MKIWLVITFAGLVTGFGLPTLARSETSTHSESSPEPTSTPTLEGYDTQILPDRHVIFRLLAPQANDVKVLMGVTSSVNESQGTKTGQMKKNANGLNPGSAPDIFDGQLQNAHPNERKKHRTYSNRLH